MLKLTTQAAQQVLHSAEQNGMKGLALRIAAKKNADGTIQYLMGFDEIKEEDVLLTSKEVDIVIEEMHKELLSGTVIDFVELEPGDFRFIFMNPNDANYTPPIE